MIEDFITHIKAFSLDSLAQQETQEEEIRLAGQSVSKYTNEFWTSGQRKANSIHELSYRACFKPQLPHFFIKHLSRAGDYIYDPFLGRGTTMLEAALLDRKPLGNDINPLSKMLTEARFLIPELTDLEAQLNSIPLQTGLKADIDLSMFYHPDTESEIVSLRNYLLEKEENRGLSPTDKWIRMVATNRLTGHSRGFFSVYTMPPNQAVSPERQVKINEKRQQKPQYRNTRKLILKKSQSLLRNVGTKQKKLLYKHYRSAQFFNTDASATESIPDDHIQLTVTSPPFLNIVQYSQDNWLRAWFNGINPREVEQTITMARTIEQWIEKMQAVFHELFRITKPGGFVAFEVGEVKNGKIMLDEYVIPMGMESGFSLIGILVNRQEFTKTANIWGVSNNSKGTNSNRIVLLQK